MPRAPSLSTTAIAEAALAAIERDGLGNLSMRNVAKVLGVGAMTLYGYVRDREELEALVVDHVLCQVDLSLPARAGWKRRLTLLLSRVREATARHPGVVPLVLTCRHARQGALCLAEAILTALDGANLSDEARAVAFRTLMGFTIGSVQLEHFGPLSGHGTATMAALSPEVFPRLTSTAARAQHLASETEFQRGLVIVLRGIARP